MAEQNEIDAALELGVEQSALAALRQARPDDLRPGPASRRDRVLPDLLHHVQSVPSRLRRRRAIYGAAVAFAAAAGALLWLSPVSTSQQVVRREPNVRAVDGELLLLRGDREQAVRQGQSLQLAVSDRVHTRSGAANLVLPTGSAVRVSPQSTVQVAQLEPGSYETLRLLEGSVHVQVPKLAAGEYFAVLTATAKVVVHGTRFDVAVGEPAQPGAACVRVQEGLVAVHTAEAVHWVGPGESSGCKLPSRAASEPAPPVEAPALPQQPTAAVSTGRGVKMQPSEAAVSADLAEQNRLFQTALTHQRRQQWSDARAAYQQLLDRFPDAPLAAEARAQLSKLAALPRSAQGE